MEPNFADLKFNRNLKTDLTAREVAKGQKAVIYAFVLNLMAVALAVRLPTMGLTEPNLTYVVIGGWALRLIVVVLGLYGIFKIANELDWPGLARVITFILLFIPVVNLITLLFVNSRATAFLKNAGYKVGLVGAYKQR